MSRIRPIRLVVPCTLLLATLFVFWKVFVEDYGPFDGAINFHSTALLDRKVLGYNYAPKFNPDDRRADGGYYDLYSNNIQQNGRVSVCVYDEPYWPDGDLSRGKPNAFPPLIRRHTIRAISPEIPMTVLALGWLCWLALIVYRFATRPNLGRGFDVVQPSTSPTEKIQ